MTRAPFTQDQVNHINEYQEAGLMHPLTCAKHSDTPLSATRAGLECQQCDYTQDWAPSAITNGEMLRELVAIRHSMGLGA